ncbi:LrgB family protein [Paludibacterium yongneupense]|uniref:LrgB family protein n=1 Tax=Paludibacterium yongneupense TaxID=400061 RepID=UPI000402DEC9|nr:LrgB family protein [Paludibacterium yongneupense]
MRDLMWPVASLVGTTILYYLCKGHYKRTRQFWCTPLLAAPVIVVALVVVLHIPLPAYFEYTHWLVALLGPATIAFALPIYRQRHMIARYPLTIIAGVVTGLILGLVSNWGYARLFHIPGDIALSLLPRSVSTPFAIQVSAKLGGMPDVTALMVVLTGVIGMLVCEPVYRVTRVKSAHARGAGLGSASHGAGTAKAHELGAQEGVIASLTMIFTGISMVLVAPLLSRLFM